MTLRRHEWIAWVVVLILGAIFIAWTAFGCAAAHDVAVAVEPVVKAKVETAVEATAAVASKVDDLRQAVGDNSQAIADSSIRNDNWTVRVLAISPVVLGTLVALVIVLSHRREQNRISKGQP